MDVIHAKKMLEWFKIGCWVVVPIFLLLIIIVSSCVNYEVIPSNRPDLIRKEWVLSFEDTFDGDEIDQNKWKILGDKVRRKGPDGDGYWMKEDAYLDGNGHLIIRARNVPDSTDYASGAISTKGKFEQQCGYFEICCNLPEEIGWWVAFWMMPSNGVPVGNEGVDGTEIDIFESPWRNKDRIQQGLHWDGYGKDHKSKIKWTGGLKGIQDGFHVFALEWNADEYIFYYDDKITWRTSAGGVSRVSSYLKVTGEITTDWLINLATEHPKKAKFPDYFIVDYVRAYENP